MVKWVMLIMLYNNPPVAFAEYPREQFCKEAAEYLFVTPEDKKANKAWCVPVTAWNGIDPRVPPLEEPKKENK